MLNDVFCLNFYSFSISNKTKYRFIDCWLWVYRKFNKRLIIANRRIDTENFIACYIQWRSQVGGYMVFMCIYVDLHGFRWIYRDLQQKNLGFTIVD